MVNTTVTFVDEDNIEILDRQFGAILYLFYRLILVIWCILIVLSDEERLLIWQFRLILAA